MPNRQEIEWSVCEKKNLDQKVHLEKKLEHFSEKKLPHPTFDQSQHRVSLEMTGYRKLETAKFGLVFVKIGFGRGFRSHPEGTASVLDVF